MLLCLTSDDSIQPSLPSICYIIFAIRTAPVACAFGAMGLSQSSVIIVPDLATKTGLWYSSVLRSAATLDSIDVNSHSEGQASLFYFLVHIVLTLQSGVQNTR